MHESGAVASRESCVTYSHVTHQYLKDGTTEKREKKDMKRDGFVVYIYIHRSDFYSWHAYFLIC